MTFRTLPFENRWTDGDHARHWHLHLERIGLDNVRLWFIMEASRQGDGTLLPSDMPLGFVHDWLAYHDRAKTRRMACWQIASTVLAAVAAVAATAVWMTTI